MKKEKRRKIGLRGGRSNETINKRVVGLEMWNRIAEIKSKIIMKNVPCKVQVDLVLLIELKNH